MNLSTFAPTDILLMGVGGKTGHWYARLLLAHGHRVIGHDKNRQAFLPEDILKNSHFEVSFAPEEELLERYHPQAITLTPGVPLSRPIFRKAAEQGIFLFSELEFTAPLLRDKYPIIGITGTDGKSTTTALTAAILNANGLPALACGNYGIPFSQILLERERYQNIQVLVAELSSYQLERCQGLALDVALYLNLAPDHLDRYPTLADYCLAKWNIYYALKRGGTFIVNSRLLPPQDTILGNYHPFFTSPREDVNIVSVDTVHLKSMNFRFEANQLFEKTLDIPLAHEADFLLKGHHNLGNILFALEAVRALYPAIAFSPLIAAAQQFSGLPHRYEILPSVDGNIYINDSKATTTQAAITALRCTTPPVFLFLGGQGKGESYEQLAQETALQKAICFVYGAEKEKLATALQLSGTEYFVFDDLRSAFYAARHLQQERKIPQVTYLLAPAVTSWDQFTSFEERGDFFRSLVQSL